MTFTFTDGSYLTGNLRELPYSSPGGSSDGSRIGKHDSENTRENFLAVDRYLDRATIGPTWLRDPRVAEVVIESLRHGADELKQYELHAFAVMANHVHVLIRPRIEIAKITRGVKGTTACRANKILGRTGQPFWQEESFDHWVRPMRFEGTITYIERNPVKVDREDSGRVPVVECESEVSKHRDRPKGGTVGQALPPVSRRGAATLYEASKPYPKAKAQCLSAPMASRSAT